MVPPVSNKVANLPATTNTPNPPFAYEAKKKDFSDYHKYGGLAREGVSCTICHQITGPGTTPEGQAAMKQFLLQAEKNKWMPANDKIWSNSFIYFLGDNTTGQFERNPANILNGPFADNAITPVPMKHSLGITPKFNSFTANSDMCGSCHSINLPNIGMTAAEYPVLTALEKNPVLKPYQHSIEQATYLEWLNSKFGPGEFGLTAKNNKSFKSCQDCHMPNSFATLDGSIKIKNVVSQIASIQDSTYPEAENSARPKDITVPLRRDFKRHELVGLNAFLIEMANQFPDIVGAQTTDYETSATTGPKQAIDNMLLSAQRGDVVTVAPLKPIVQGGNLTTEVALTNQTGHRFPSGVSFRRAFIEFAVLDKDGKVLWISGDTDAVGVVTNGRNGPRLDTEFLEHRTGTNKLADYQPHYRVITRQDQVQIYEELIADANNDFTTSFVHRVTHVKDNRLLPQGWVPSFKFAQAADKTGKDPKQGKLLLEFMQATDPEGPSVIGGPPLFGDRIVIPNNGDSAQTTYTADPNFVDTNIGSDSLVYRIPLADIKGTPATVRATVYSQSFMPFWFHQRFKLAAEAKAAGLNTPETDRLFYMASRLKLEGTQLANWKLPLVSTSAPVLPK
ncbi:MAG TPA: hypothetical protein VHR66_22215 [Gemmataceae bacterium]|nr:hypothetical protein [Gemmataceae bacterium]